MPKRTLTIVEDRDRTLGPNVPLWVVLNSDGAEVFTGFSFNGAVGYVWTHLFLLPSPRRPSGRPVA